MNLVASGLRVVLLGFVMTLLWFWRGLWVDFRIKHYALYNGVFPWWAQGGLSCTYSDGLSVNSHSIVCISSILNLGVARNAVQSGQPSHASSHDLSGEACTHIGCISYHNLAWVGHCLVGLPSTPIAISGEKNPFPLWPTSDIIDW